MNVILSVMSKDFFVISTIIIMLVSAIYIFMFPYIDSENKKINEDLKELYEEYNLSKPISKFSRFSKILLILTIFFALSVIIVLKK